MECRTRESMMTSAKSKIIATHSAVIGATVFASQYAFAVTAPATGSFAYDLYDVVVVDMIQGAPGFVGGLVGVVYSATKIATNWMLAALGVVGSTAVIQADTITTSLGALI